MLRQEEAESTCIFMITIRVLVLRNIGFSSSRVSAIVAIVGALLTLGNVSFKPDSTGEGSEVLNEDVLKKSASLLGLQTEVGLFAECLTQKKLYVGKEVSNIFTADNDKIRLR